MRVGIFSRKDAGLASPRAGDATGHESLEVRLEAWSRHVLILFCVGVALLACDLQSQYLMMPYWLEDLSRALYKIFFFAVLPFRGIVMLIIPSVDHHWPLAHHVVTSLGAPFFWYFAWMGFSGTRRVWRSCRPTRPAIEAEVTAVVEQATQGINRRQFLVRSTAGVVGVATGGVGSYASFFAPENLHIRPYDLGIKDLPAEFEGFRIVHVSDTHYGPFVAMPYLHQVFDRANSLNPDFIFLTGDHVHYTPDAVAGGIEALARLKGRLGMAAVMGNHEHWEGAEACRAQFRNCSIPLVDNARLFLTPAGLSDTPVDGRSVCIGGVGDLWEDEVSFDKALADVPADMPRLILSHNPDTAELVEAHHRVDAMFSGHTHGGQIAFPVIGAPVSPSKYGHKYLGGLCHGPRCPVVVSRGVGLAGVPLRLGVPPEIGVITLRRQR